MTTVTTQVGPVNSLSFPYDEGEPPYGVAENVDRPSPPQPQRVDLRASDADRERVASVLRDSFAEGRLTTDEFQERLEAAYAARTLGQLDGITRDLPAAAAPPPPPAAPVRRSSHGLREHVTVYVLVMLFLVVIWAVTDFGGYFWPIWPILGWGLGVASHALGVTSGPGFGPHYRRRARRQARREDRRRRREE